MLLKVKARPQQRVDITLLVEMFRSRVVDIGQSISDDHSALWVRPDCH